MDRTGFAACAGLLLPLGAALSTGCGAGDLHHAPASQAEAAPAPLDLAAIAPGPWRRCEASHVTLVAATDEATGVTEPAATAPLAATEIEAAGEAPVDAVHPRDEPSIEAPATKTTVSDPDALPATSSLPLGPTDVTAGAPSTAPPTAPGSIEPVLPQQLAADRARTQLPWADLPPRTAAMTAVLRRADLRVRQGFQRAARGAHFSARADFVAALEMIAEANDAQQRTRLYTSALNSGLVALKESTTFTERGADHTGADVARIVAAHQTTILKDGSGVQLAPLAAAQRYCGYAQEQLAAAAAREAIGSMALFGLAKVALATSDSRPTQSLEQTMQATVLYKAALMASGDNFCAANELGVLLAENGNLEQARNLFWQSVSVAPHAATWHNLAVIHARLGETHLAQMAQARCDALPKPRSPQGGPEVEWVDAQAFARIGSASDATLPAMRSTVQTPAKSAVNVAKKPTNDWLPWSSRR